MRWLYGAIALLGLMVGISWFHPDSAPLVRWQASQLAHYSKREQFAAEPSPSLLQIWDRGSPESYREANRRFLRACEQLAREHPSDPQISALQAIASVEARSPLHGLLPLSLDDHYTSNPLILNAIWALQKRFPHDKGLLATLLHGELSRLKLRRDRVDDLFYRLEWTSYSFSFSSSEAWWSKPEVAARVLTLARKGERLDPQNSFFTLMRAAALLEQERDREAIQALLEAAHKPVWNDYRGWLVEGYYKAVRRARLSRQLHSPENGWVEWYQAPWSTYAWLPSHYWLTVRLFVGLAATHEKRGKWHEGLTIRLALAHLIAKMRYQHSSAQFIRDHCNLFRLTGLFPAEQLPPPANRTDPETQRLAAQILRDCPATEPLTALRWGFFLHELEKRGFQREAAWLLNELRANQQALAIMQRFNERLINFSWWGAANEWWKSSSRRWAIAGALCLWLAILMAIGGLLTSLLQRLRVPEAALLPIIFAMGMLGVLGFVVSDAGTLLVLETVKSLQQAQMHSVVSAPPTHPWRKQQLIAWLLDNPHAIQIALGMMLFVLLGVVLLFLILLQQRRVQGVMQPLRIALWTGSACFMLLYLTALGNYFLTQSRFLQMQRGYLLGGRNYIQRITGEAMPAPQPPLR